MSLVAGGRVRGRAGRLAVGLVVGVTLLAGCARFDESASSPFTPEPSWQDADLGPTDKQAPTSAQRPAGPCVDPDPNVVISCLGVTGGIVVLGDGTSIVLDRTDLEVLTLLPPVGPSEVPPPPAKEQRIDQEIDTGTADGGLMDIALSPSYYEDGLYYLYVTGPGDNRVIRVSEDGSVKPILTGIPKGATGNRGAIDFAGGDLMVLTGNAGNPAAADDPNSLAGKLLRVPNPSPNSSVPEVVISGIGIAGDVCVGPQSIWVTDRTAVEDRLQHVTPEGDVTRAWSWPDRPGVAGCAAAADGVAIAMTDAKAVAFAKADPATHAITEAPTLTMQDRYGRLNGAALGPDGAVWVGTVNKGEGGTPGEYDDRVVRVPPPAGGPGSGPD
ncbi:PQQ-dependent sugar dehydrogenase [Nocardia sp. CC201C]|uniref:PQQ-dependent sugar dehydrogenase n=1 Tax=Nocardia sp. CC201C TaxID=3044575 RepID=UPI0024A9EC9D|nr:PQQ-dependent sugar dehydrogenase [Nocardia sp. CC201C]